jgi:hypothetical protein
LTYDPFKIIRAQSEQAGDIIGEGLMNLLEDDGPGYLPQGTDPRYWSGALQARRTLIRQIQAAVSSNQRLQPICSNVQEALSAARGVHSRIAPHEIAEYVNDWLDDLPNWQAYLAELASRPQEPAPAMNDSAPGAAV